MKRNAKKLWNQLNNFYNLDDIEKAILISDLMVYLEKL